MARFPTIEDVAREASVSRQTVSNVLNAPDIVREETRERVRDVIDRLGYHPHASARRLRSQYSSTIAIRMDPITNGISGSILDRFLHDLTARAAERGMRVLLFTATDPADELAQLRALRDGADVDAVVITSTYYGDPRIPWLIDAGMPFVSFGRPWGEEHAESPDHRWVDVDGFAGVLDATRHLIGRGIRRIGFLGWPAGSATGDDRRRGWTTAMREQFDLTDHELELLTVRVEESVPGARMAVEKLLPLRLVDALVCVSDSVALGAMMAVTEAGRRGFPVIGFDNTPVAKAVGLSSVDQRTDEIAATALDLLMGEQGHRVLTADEVTERSAHRLVAPKLIVRRSSHLTVVEEAGSDPGGN
ncbi:LacI family DNA-binding transcriptional regulator [Salinibacterium soli]|uniref:LacI family DNA-binding transcriptional regulator n=1 Tax=Antiquaquibacter soli TaxID=3064523 RepID=A0ABT9BUG0_9MICO|nr:LacI family DNA-binding transcriptional regulator [Protaetiibacter sp. WY-16]MDO7882987.1 LacI family DNA-binding transcriptional regulator [Protaetiibacter sp. WY-16]